MLPQLSALLLSITTCLVASERLLCGFEPQEMAAWPVSVWNGMGDTNEVAYFGNAYYAQTYVSWMTRHDPVSATQGEWTLCEKIFNGTVPDNKQIMAGASLYRDWNTLSGSLRPLDSTRTFYGENFDAAWWMSDRYMLIFSLYRTLDGLPDSLQDWSGYDFVYFDAKSTDANAHLQARIEARQRPTGKVTFSIPAGGAFHTVRIPLRQLAWVSHIDSAQLSDIKNFRIMIRNVFGPTTIFIDNIRLATADEPTQYPVVDPMENPLEPWLLTSQYKPPASPPIRVPERVTGPIAAEPPVIVAANGVTSFYREPSLRWGVVPFDNTKCGLIDYFHAYRYWAETQWDVPNTFDSAGAFDISWLGSVDGGATWASDETAGEWPLKFSTTSEGSVETRAFPDPYLRGYGYLIKGDYCGHKNGTQYRSFHTFFRIRPGDNNRWEVFPKFTYDHPPQRVANVVVSDIPRGCFGDVMNGANYGPVKMAVLPSGRIWFSTYDDHLNPLKSLYAMYCSYSDDGGMRWQYVKGNIPGVYIEGETEISGSKGALFMCNYQGKVIVFTSIGYNDEVYYQTCDNGPWSTPQFAFKQHWGERDPSTIVAYKDSTLFAAFGNGEMMIFRNGTASFQQVAMNVRYPVLTLCGERIWYIYQKNGHDPHIYCRKYFINQDRWADEIILATANRLYALNTSNNPDDTHSVLLKVAPVSPPSHAPLYWREGHPTIVNRTITKFLRIPIDAEEAALDPDYDGLENSSERADGTDSLNPDTDGDGLWDGQEVCLLTTNPKNPDTDNDGDNDATEVYAYSNPKSAAQTATHNQAPQVILSDSLVNNTLFLDAANSTDAESDFLRYFWEIDLGNGDTVKAEGPRLIYILPDANSYPVKLTVDDGRGNSVSNWLVTSTEQTANHPEANFAITRIHPNPFNPSTAIHFTLSRKETIALTIYDLAGRKVRELFKGTHEMGPHSEVWNGRDDRDKPVAGGVFVVRLSTRGQQTMKKVLLLK
ncbi:MAG: T9SS type A sorting domain-containing protein [Fibrobacterota bacterium]